MLSPVGQKKIEKKLRNIYNFLYSKIEIDLYSKEIIQVINRFNKKVFLLMIIKKTYKVLF